MELIVMTPSRLGLAGHTSALTRGKVNGTTAKRSFAIPPLARRDLSAARKRAKQAERFIQSDTELDRVRSISDETLFRVFQL